MNSSWNFIIRRERNVQGEFSDKYTVTRARYFQVCDRESSYHCQPDSAKTVTRYLKTTDFLPWMIQTGVDYEISMNETSALLYNLYLALFCGDDEADKSTNSGGNSKNTYVVDSRARQR